MSNPWNQRIAVRLGAVETGFLACLLLVAVPGCAPSAADLESVPVWSRWEQSFTAAEGAGPDVELTALLTGPNGGERNVDGFWDGDDVWKVRFMPEEPGVWSYRTRAHPPQAGLDGIEGSFQAVPADGSTRFLEHGAVGVSSNRRHLAHADGTPFFWLADTAWSGALKSSDEAWSQYLADRVHKGFTAIQVVSTQWRAAHADAEGQVAYTGFEDIRINPRFFDRIDKRMDEINEAGLLAAPVLLWTLGEPEHNPGRLPEDQAIELARYIVARYQANHVVWFLAGDESYSGDRGERWRNIGRGVFEGREHAPATIHPRGRQWFFGDFAQEDWLDFIIYQSSHGGGPKTLEWLQSGPPATAWRDEPVRPIINSEPGYEDHFAWEREDVHTADDVRRQIYWSLLNTPTAGVTYGANGIWSWELEAGTPQNHDRAGVAKPWDEAMELPGSAQMRHVADLFGSIEWWRLRPRPELVASQPDDFDEHIGAAASEEGDLAVVYIPRGHEVELKLDLLAPNLESVWFNPRTGERQPGEGPPYAAPDDEDWVLVMASEAMPPQSQADGSAR